MNITASNIVAGMSELIMQDLQRYESERAHPSADVDRMDEKINFFHQRVCRLRYLREEFEKVMAQVAP